MPPAARHGMPQRCIGASAHFARRCRTAHVPYVPARLDVQRRAVGGGADVRVGHAAALQRPWCWARARIYFYHLFGTCRRRAPRARSNQKGGIGKVSVQCIFLCLQIGPGRWRSPSACPEISKNNALGRRAWRSRCGPACRCSAVSRATAPQSPVFAGMRRPSRSWCRCGWMPTGGVLGERTVAELRRGSGSQSPGKTGRRARVAGRLLGAFGSA